MPDLRFQVESARATAAPSMLHLRLAITNLAAGEDVHLIAVSVQLQIEPARRRYSDAEKIALNDLFGEPSRWPTTVRPIFWTSVNANVPGFQGRTEFDLPVPCELETEVAAARYVRALESGDVPVILLFSGRVLYLNGPALQMSPISWSQEASFRIPLGVLRDLISEVGQAPANSRGMVWT